jgi:hypothetical protein
VRPCPGVEGNHISPAKTKVYACCSISLLRCRTTAVEMLNVARLAQLPSRKFGKAREKLGT